jgi:hypothetical protein
MAFRFGRRIRIAPGLSLNLGKRGVSLSAGVRGGRVTLGSRGARATAGLPGTGLSYSTKIGGGRTADATPADPVSNGEIRLWLIVLAMAAAFGFVAVLLGG